MLPQCSDVVRELLLQLTGYLDKVAALATANPLLPALQAQLHDQSSARVPTASLTVLPAADCTLLLRRQVMRPAPWPELVAVDRCSHTINCV